MIQLLHFYLLSWFIFKLKKKYETQPLGRWWYVAVFIKIIFGVFYGILYIKVYGSGGDSLLYFKEVSVLVELAYKDFNTYFTFLFSNQYFPYLDLSEEVWQQSRVLVTVKLLSIWQIFTLNNYWLQGFYLSFLSGWAMWYMANVLVKLFPNTYISVVFSFFLFPSIQLWSSGYTKESITMFFLCFSLAFFLGLYFKIIVWQKQRWIIIFTWLFAFFWLYLVKFYYLAALVPTIFAFLLTDYCIKKIEATQKFNKLYFFPYFLFGLIWIMLVLPITQIHYTLHLDYFLLALTYNHNSTYIHSLPQDLIHYSIYPAQGYISLEGYSYWSYIYNAPLAFFSACFRPFLWETYQQKLKILMAMENLIFMIFVILTILISFKKYIFSFFQKQKTNQNLSIYLLTFALLWYGVILLTLLAFASPNLGGLMRYRIAVYPFWLYFFMANSGIKFYLIEKIFQRIGFYQK